MAEAGVWIVFDYDYGPYFIAAYQDPEAALGAITLQGYGKAVFARWGEGIADAEKRLREEPAADRAVECPDPGMHAASREDPGFVMP